MLRAVCPPMNRTIQAFPIPSDLKSLEDSSALLPGESHQEFDVIRQMIVADVAPKTNLASLWTIDLVDLSWEILPYRRLKEKILQINRPKAISSILRKLDGAGIPREAKSCVESHSERAADEWCNDPA